MNASANQSARDRLTADQRANEPSMEEILASIRRIISESESAVPVVSEIKSAPKAAAAPIQPEPIPLHRGTPRPQAPVNQALFDEPLDLRGSLAPETRHAPQAAPKPAPLGASNPAETPLLSQQSGTSVTAAFSALTAARSVQDSLNIDAMARDMLRPMLKTWLDDNLPTLVERLVRAEIERVARGGK